MTLSLYNSLTRNKEEFKTIKPGEVGLYTCGPTVYNYAHIGNLRTYIFEDILKRVLLFNGFSVRHVMNITDVGHLTGDRDMGEDKIETGAAREGKVDVAFDVLCAQLVSDGNAAADLADAVAKGPEVLDRVEIGVWAKIKLKPAPPERAKVPGRLPIFTPRPLKKI